MGCGMTVRRREIVLAVAIGALAAFAAIGILSDGFGGPGSSFEDIPMLSAPPEASPD